MLELSSVIISKVSTLADKCLRLQIDTRELPPDSMAQIFQAYMQGQEGIKIADIKLPESKSSSSRLRATIFVLWKNTGEKGDFEEYYNKYMNKIIERVKENIP